MTEAPQRPGPVSVLALVLLGGAVFVLPQLIRQPGWFAEVDEAARTATASASAREARNRGSAQAQIDFAITPEGDGSRVSVRTDLNLVGPAAQYGRGAGMLSALAEEMLAQFAACLHERLLDPAAAAEGQPEAAPLNAATVAGKAAIRRVRRALGPE